MGLEVKKTTVDVKKIIGCKFETFDYKIDYVLIFCTTFKVKNFWYW